MNGMAIRSLRLTVGRMAGRINYALPSPFGASWRICNNGRKYYAAWKRLRHFTWLLGQDAREGNRFVSMIRPRDHELIAMSNFLAAEFHRNYGITPQHIIPNGIDASLYGTVSADRDIDVLGVGSLIPLKQYDLFVSVVQELSVHLGPLRSVICGKGPEQETLARMIGSLGMERQVTLAGEKPHREAIAYMQRAKILLHTSNYEGFSTVCLEALYAGARVISFTDPVGSPVSNWYVVKTKAEMVARALSLLRDTHTPYESVQLHTMDDSARQMMALYD
jgi:glycosyltransferase involved in cell wall biosynthesis